MGKLGAREAEWLAKGHIAPKGGTGNGPQLQQPPGPASKPHTPGARRTSQGQPHPNLSRRGRTAELGGVASGAWSLRPRGRIWKAAQALQTVRATTILGIPQGGRWEVGGGRWGVTRRCLQVTCLRRGWLSAGDCPENSLALVLGSRPSPPGDLGSGWAGLSETTVPLPSASVPQGRGKGGGEAEGSRHG